MIKDQGKENWNEYMRKIKSNKATKELGKLKKATKKSNNKKLY